MICGPHHEPWHRLQSVKNNLQYIFKKEETNLIAKQYILLKHNQAYNKTVSQYLCDCGFGFFNNNIYLSSLNSRISKIYREINGKNFNKNLKLLNEKFLKEINKNLT